MGSKVCLCGKKQGIEPDFMFERKTSVASSFREPTKARYANLNVFPEYSKIIDQNFFETKKIILIQKSFRKFLSFRNSGSYKNSQEIISLNLSLSKKEILLSSFIANTEESEIQENLKQIFRKMNKDYKLISNTENTECSLENKRGFCIQKWSDGSYLQGKYKENKLHGIAKIRCSEGRSLYGEFKKSKVEGFAILLNKTGTVYEGTWVSNQLEGICIEKWQDGTFFQGQYKHGKRNGLGTYRLPDGTLYEGSFVSDSLCGWGIMHFSNDNQYSGEWLDDKMHGYGEFRWDDGRVYIGLWEEDRKHGFGTIYWTNPEKAFVGFWVNNKQHGVGCVITQKVVKYGIWENGERVKWLRDYESAISKFDLFQYEYSKFFPVNLESAKFILNQMN